MLYRFGKKKKTIDSNIRLMENKFSVSSLTEIISRGSFPHYTFWLNELGNDFL